MTPSLAQLDYSNCAHIYCKRNGTRDGKQRYRCYLCQAHFTGGGRPQGMAMLAMIAPAYRDGLSIHSAARKFGCGTASLTNFLQVGSMESACIWGHAPLKIVSGRYPNRDSKVPLPGGPSQIPSYRITLRQQILNLPSGRSDACFHCGGNAQSLVKSGRSCNRRSAGSRRPTIFQIS
jgi:hypothetical protein